jgi:hypothetical protein
MFMLEKLQESNGEATMKLARWIVAWLIVYTTALASNAQGTVPHTELDKYSAHAQQNEVSIGATLLTAGQVRKVFRTDVNKCCVVVEVAIYPQKDRPIEVWLNDFALRPVGRDTGARPSSPKVVAWNSSHDSDRLRPMLIADMEQEVGEKSLPLGSTAAPVSGYLYFSLENAKHAKHQLEYTLNGNKVTLALD